MDEVRAGRLFRESGAERWGVPREAFAEALCRGVAKAFPGGEPSTADFDRYIGSLHLADLALACACALGIGAAWEHFMTEFRPTVYRAADGVAPGGDAREVADGLYAELYGMKSGGDARPSLFGYFHGRSSLATWLRALVAQRYVDHLRARRRLAPLPDEGSAAALPAAPAPSDPDRTRFAGALRAALGQAIAQLEPRDRLRLGCYYAQGMTLAAIGRLTREHEATVSRHLARTRRALREAVEQSLRSEHGFAESEVAECFASVTEDAGSLDLEDWLAPGSGKRSAVDRSTGEGFS